MRDTQKIETYKLRNVPLIDLEKGPEALSDAALLAILLRTGRQGQNAIALAREIISKFGGLYGLMLITSEDLLSKIHL